MARLPALVDTISRIDGRPRGAIDNVARVVREAGLIQTTKRGLGAAPMTAVDAAWLLIGLYAGDQATDADQVARAYGSLKARRPPWHDLPPPLESFGYGMELVTAIATVIELGPKLAESTERTRQGIGAHVDPQMANGWPAGISVLLTIRRPTPEAALIFAWPGNSKHKHTVITRALSFSSRGSPQGPFPAVEMFARLHTPVFTALHEMLFPLENKA